jgi:flavin reductase (DIM6/NTAB) family NADH-FMN oxidoreductase RutF
MVIAMAIVRIPNSGSWKAIELKFEMVKNLFGRETENMMSVSANSPHKRDKFGYRL